MTFLFKSCGVLIAAILATILVTEILGCKLREINGNRKKLVCVCDERRCDKLTFQWPQRSGQATLVQSNQMGLRFSQSSLNAVSSCDNQNPSESSVRIRVKSNERYQEILGWGGAFSDAASLNIANLSQKLGETLIERYFGDGGLEYNFARVPIAGTDFSARPYSYDDSQEPDYNLTRWALAPEDTQYKIPCIKRAMQAARRKNRNLKLFASPWSPPAWMKTSKSLVGGHLINEDRIYRSYTEYLMKFYDAYLKHGIRFWGATVQNEPTLSLEYGLTFNSLEMNTTEMIKLIGDYLGPALRQRNYTKQNFKLMVGDDPVSLIDHQVPEIMRDKKVQEIASGLAFHWYAREAAYEKIDEVYDAIKNNIDFVLMTEASVIGDPDLGSWDRGERYAADIIEDLNRHTAGWIDWNLALNVDGGPNWVNNFVDSPILVNGSANEFYQQPMYHALAHFSRFFKPGAEILDTKVLSSGDDELLAVSAIDEKSGHVIVNVLNRSEREERVMIDIQGLGRNRAGPRVPLSITVSGRSLNSVIVKI